MLAGALGGLAGLIGSRVARPEPAVAAAGDPLILGSLANNSGTLGTKLSTSVNGNAFAVSQTGSGGSANGIRGDASDGTGGVFTSTNNNALFATVASANRFAMVAVNGGTAGTGGGLLALGGSNYGVKATSGTTAIRGTSTAANAPAIRGESSGAEGTGVSGHSDQWVGVAGTSTDGFAIWGQSGTNYAGFFVNQVYMGSWIDIEEIGDPGAAGPNQARLFTRDNGGKTELCVRFPTGVLQVLASEP